MSFLWSFNDFLAAIGGDFSGKFERDITGISVDSRTLKEGNAFFAIQGIRFDGHDFLEVAIKRGASILVVEKKYAKKFAEIKGNNRPFLFVKNVLSALENLALAARIRTKAKIIAITGSVGKTTLKAMLHHVLLLNGKIHANPASFNNHWGVPLTLARMPFNTDFGIFEIGMNHANEIRHLVRLVAPDLVLISRVGAAHLGNFKNLKAVAAAKAEIFEAVNPKGYALLNADDHFFSYLAEKAKQAGVAHVLSFGKTKTADYRLLDSISCSNLSKFRMKIRKKEIKGQLTVAGHHMIQNALSILGIVDILQMDIKKPVESLKTFISENGRGTHHRLKLPDPDGGDFLLIDESYNANPVSMQVGLELLAISDIEGKGRRIAVLGDMLELGFFSRKAHEELFFMLKKNRVDLVFLCGNEMRFLADILITVQEGRIRCYYRREAEDLLPLIRCEVRAGDNIMVKSSKGIGTARLVKALVKTFEI